MSLLTVSIRISAILSQLLHLVLLIQMLLLEMLAFSGCGAFLQKMDDPLNKRLSSSKLHFNGSHHSALFVFINNSVNFYRVNITNYYGFAVIGLDLKSSTFSSVGVSMDANAAVSSQSKPSVGSGILILFSNQSEPFSYILLFYDCYFSWKL